MDLAVINKIFKRGSPLLGLCNRLHYIYLLIKVYFLNRHREASYTRLLSVDNTRRSKCFLKVAKMWIKEIRFKSSPVYVNLILTFFSCFSSLRAGSCVWVCASFQARRD